MRLKVGENKEFNHRVAGILIHDGRVLLHHPRGSHWALPGGHIEFLEDARTTLVREMVEELAVDVEVGRLVWVCEHAFMIPPKTVHEVSFYFEMSLPEGHPLFGEEGEIPAVEDSPLTFLWIPLDVLAPLELYPAFLKEGLNALPEAVTHLVTRYLPD